MNRHFVFLVPKAGLAELIIAWTSSLAHPCCRDRIPTWHLFLDGNSVDTFCSLKGRMVSAAFGKAGKEVLCCCLCLTESTHCSQQVDITRGVNNTGRTSVVTSPKHSKKTKMMQPKWKFLLRWVKILRSSSSHFFAFGGSLKRLPPWCSCCFPELLPYYRHNAWKGTNHFMVHYWIPQYHLVVMSLTV